MEEGSEQKVRALISIERHFHLAELFRKNHLAFEKERKRLITDKIAANPEKKIRKKLTEMQYKLDKVLNGEGSPIIINV